MTISKRIKQAFKDAKTINYPTKKDWIKDTLSVFKITIIIATMIVTFDFIIRFIIINLI